MDRIIYRAAARGRFRSRACDRRQICDRNGISLGHGISAWLGLGPVGSCSFPSARWHIFYVSQIMAKSIHVIHKKRGRPATGHDPVLTLRLSPSMRIAVENWAKLQKDKPSRSEAIRRLIEIALAARPKRQSGRGEK